MAPFDARSRRRNTSDRLAGSTGRVAVGVGSTASSSSGGGRSATAFSPHRPSTQDHTFPLSGGSLLTFCCLYRVHTYPRPPTMTVRPLPNAVDLSHHLNQVSTGRFPSPLKDIMGLMGVPGMISLAGGPYHVPPFFLCRSDPFLTFLFPQVFLTPPSSPSLRLPSLPFRPTPTSLSTRRPRRTSFRSSWRSTRRRRATLI